MEKLMSLGKYQLFNAVGAHLSKIPRLVFGLAILLVIFSSFTHANTKPLLDNPRLFHLDTSNGLTQNTISDLHIDSSGFLWVANEEGLNRYDGHKVIHVQGSHGQLLNNPIYDIFEDSRQNLWISTGITGVYLLDPQTRETKSIVAEQYLNDPEWTQYAENISEAEDGNILIASNHQVDLYSYETGETNTLFVLGAEEIENRDIIRTAFKSGDMLLIGTSSGLLAKNLVSDQVSSVEFLPKDSNEFNDINSHNVKQLKEMPNGQLWIGTVKGLYAMPLGALKQFVIRDWTTPSSTTINATHNIWSLHYFDDETIYIGSDKGLFKTDISGSPLTFLFEPQQYLEEISDKSIKAIETDQYGNVWFGSYLNGAMFWTPQSTSFKSISNLLNTQDGYKLSHNNVLSLYQENEKTLWAGTTNGLNKIDLTTNEITSFLSSSVDTNIYDQSYILQIIGLNNGELWLATGSGLRIFDTHTLKLKILENLDSEQKVLFDSYSYGIALQGSKTIWSLSDTGLIRFNTEDMKAEFIDLSNEDINLGTIDSILGYDIRTSNLMLSGAGALIGINTETLKPMVLHSIKKSGASLSMIPNSWLRDTKNNFWLSYAGKALYQLDGNDFTQISEYNSGNILPTNLIYGLALDYKDNLWFSSHSGIHEFSTETLDISSYQYMQGVSASEFNDGAFTMLSDGRLAYGSTKGITLFEPSEVSTLHNKKFSTPIITELELSSRDLSLPFTNLNDSEIVLEHNDIGLTVYFSSLDFSSVQTERFNYRLISNDKIINFPAKVAGKIELFMLSPGNHTLEIFEVGGSDTSSQTAKLFIRVKYAPLTSPLALTIYAVLICLIILLFVMRRNRIRAHLAAAHNQIALYNNRLTSALKASNSDIWEWSSNNQIIETRRLKNELGYSDSGNSVDFEKHLSLIHEVDRLQYLSAWRQFIRGEEEQFDNTYRMKHANGEYLWFRDAGSISSVVNEVITVTGTYTNVTDSVASKERLKLFGDAFKHTRDWVLIFDRDKQPLGGNPSFYKAFKINEDTDFSAQLMYIVNNQDGMKHKFLSKLATLKPGEHWKTELEFVVSGKKITTLTDVNAIADENDERLVVYYLVILTDITEQKEAQTSLVRLANYDVLTGLINRTLLIEKLKQAILYARRHSTSLSVIFIDLDRFKPINDTFGHQAGDKVIIEIAKRIKDKLRDNDIVSRLGGDEFVVVLEETQEIQSVNKLVAELLVLVEQPIFLGSHSVSVSASAGIAVYPDDALDAESLLRNADVAMYSAKELGKNGYQHFTATMNEKVQQDMLLQNKLKVAVARDEFENFYQPIIDTHSKKTVGFEMLMRWQSDKQFISPGVFIPIAEQIGLIVDMTMKAIERGLADVASWYEKGFEGYMAINLSAKQFSTRPDFEKILQLLEEHSLPSSCLRFEITEGLLVDNNDNTMDYMQEMRDLGFKISLDDYGTGYSSLRYLKDFPIDVLKIDKSFVDDINVDKGTESIIESTLIMTKMLNMDTVAEGIETSLQVEYFGKTNCRYLQGFYFSKPVDQAHCYELLQKDWSNKFDLESESAKSTK
ncbi:MAG: diguanylate cyclase (GGDEF)-like protein [Glaciecola sp.]|jgi:diguanylate cyclase (GGDEF)-like protein